MMAVDDDALEALIVRRALELLDRGPRIADRQRRQSEESGRMAPDCFGEKRVRLSRDGFGLFDPELLDAGRCQ